MPEYIAREAIIEQLEAARENTQAHSVSAVRAFQAGLTARLKSSTPHPPSIPSMPQELATVRNAATLTSAPR